MYNNRRKYRKRKIRNNKKNLGCRISNLDPNGRYRKKYQDTLDHFLGHEYCDLESKHPLTITYAVGGAGAQREIGKDILVSLQEYIRKGEIRLNLVAGIKNDIYRYFEEAVRECNLEDKCGKTINIIYSENKMDYFAKFNHTLLTTDILWTKPSELSFYSALGLPIIMAPPIGSQEKFNRAWLYSVGSGLKQENPKYTN